MGCTAQKHWNHKSTLISRYVASAELESPSMPISRSPILFIRCECWPCYFHADSKNRMAKILVSEGDPKAIQKKAILAAEFKKIQPLNHADPHFSPLVYVEANPHKTLWHLRFSFSNNLKGMEQRNGVIFIKEIKLLGHAFICIFFSNNPFKIQKKLLEENSKFHAFIL